MSAAWNTLTIRAKLLVSIGAILLIFTVTLAVDFACLAGQERGVRNLTGNLAPALSAAREERQHFLEMAERSARFHLNHTPQQLQHYTEFYGAALHNANATLTALDAFPLTGDERSTVAAAAEQVSAFDAAAQRSFAQKRAGDAAGSLDTFLKVHTSALSDLINKLNDSIGKRYEAAALSAVEEARKAEIVTIIAGLVAIVISFALGALVGRSISLRLQRVTIAIRELVHEEIGALVASMKQLAQGDLTARVSSTSKALDVDGSDEPAQLARAYNEMRDGLQAVAEEFVTTIGLLSSTVGTIKNSAESVTSAAQQIAEGNVNLSQRTEEQASGLEETASSMEEFTATVKQNSESAQEANLLGSGAREQALRSGKVMGSVVTTMAAINESSQRVVDIISVIDAIAFQTNILALNASVEAARAGEQGRGFAVVAGEVRGLAQRSAAAAKEIKALIDDAAAKASHGSSLVKKAGSSMDELVTSVERVTTILSDIAAASREQSSGIDQVNKAIAQMDEVTQQNAALVEEAAAAAGSLEEQARSLLSAVATFTLEAAPAAPPRISQEAPPVLAGGLAA